MIFFPCLIQNNQICVFQNRKNRNYFFFVDQNYFCFKQNLLILTGSTSFQFSLMILDETTNNLSTLPLNLSNSYPNIISVYSLEDIIIGCTLSSITVYQIHWETVTLKSLGNLRETNGNLCSISQFEMTKLDQTFHIKQTISGNINLNIIDTEKKTNQSSAIAQFTTTNNVLLRQTSKKNNQKQLLLEFKNHGMIYVYDILKKNIVNQIRYWNIVKDYYYYILFSYVKMNDIMYLFCGYEYKVFKVKIVNIKTLQITYEQEFPEIIIPFSEIYKFKYPIYFNNTDSFIVNVQREYTLSEDQQRCDFLFFRSKIGSLSNTPNRYQLVRWKTFDTKYFVVSTQAEKLLIFTIYSTRNYNCFIIDNNGDQVMDFGPYYSRSIILGQVSEEKKQAIIFGYEIQITVNLTSLTSTNLNYTSKQFCPLSQFFSPDFSKVFIQNCIGYYAFYFYPLLNGLMVFINMSYINQQIFNLLKKQETSVSNAFIFTYKWFGNYLAFNSASNLLQIFDSTKVKFFQQTSIHGSNQYSTVWDTYAVFFNNLAVAHYDLTTQNLLLADDITIIDQYILTTSTFRNNYVFGNRNIIQAKKYSEITLAISKYSTQTTSNQFLFCSYIPELNYIVIMAQNYIRIYDAFKVLTLIKSIPISITLDRPKSNFSLQEVFTRTIFYYQPSDTIILVYGKYLFCVSASSYTIVFSKQYLDNLQSFKSIIVDKDLGYLFSTNLDEDCVLNMRTYERKCYKEIESYTGSPESTINDYMQQLFLNKKTKTVIICQMTSVRLFSLTQLKYVGSLYRTNFNAKQFFYNYNYNYIIFTNQVERTFMTLDLSNMLIYRINLLPQPSQGYQTTDYRFLLDKQTYIYINSNVASISFYSQITHTLQNLIYLDYALYPYSTTIFDEENQYIFLIDRTNTVQHISYKTNKVIFKYQLNSTDLTDVQKDMIWDSYKQKLIVNSNTTLYVIGIQKQLIEFYYYDVDKIVQIQLIPNANLFSVSSYISCSLFDYDYLITDNKETFPNQIHPRYYKVNEDTIFHISDFLCQANLYQNKKIKGSWIRNNIFQCFIRIAENDNSKQQVYAILDKEIVILDVSGSEMVQTDQYFLNDNIIEILYEDNSHVFLYSQSQQIMTLQKKQKTIKVNIVMSVSQGIGSYYFSKDSMLILFTDQMNNNSINFVQLIQNSDGLKGQINTPLVLIDKINDFKFINETVIVTIHDSNIRLYNIISLSLIKSVDFPVKHYYSNVKVDLDNNRIFVQNKLTGSLIYDFNLVQSQQKRINTFSNDISFDQYFIYSVTSHSANIYFRKDLKFLINFRNFDTSLTLKKITYVGVGYIFMVEFISKLSLYEFSPITGQSVEKDFVSINQYNIIKYTLNKLAKYSQQQMYQFDIIGLTLEGMLQYSLELNMLSQETSSSCSIYFSSSDSAYQEAINLNQLTQLLIDKKITLEKLQITTRSGQLLHLSNIGEEIVGSNFGIAISGQNGNEYQYISNSKISQNLIKYLKMKKMELRILPQIYQEFILLNKIPNSFEINKIQFPFLTQLFIEDMILNEVQLDISNISQIIIKNLTFTNSVKLSQNSLKSLTRLKISQSQLVHIELMILDGCNFDNLKPLLEIINSNKIVIDNLQISNSQLKGLSQVIYFASIEQLEIGQIQVLMNDIEEISFLYAQKINSLKIANLNIMGLQFKTIDNKNQRILENNKKTTKKLFEFLEIQTIQIDSLILNQLYSNSNSLIQIFSINHVEQQIIISNIKINDIKIQKNQEGIIFSLQGIKISQFQSVIVGQVSYLQLFVLDSYQISREISYTSYFFNISNIQISNYKISLNNIISAYSQVIKVEDFSFKLILYDESTKLTLPAIKFKATSSMNISNINIDQIKLFQDSVIQIYQSANIQIENSKFSNISSFCSGPALSILQSDGITMINNIFLNNDSKNGSGGALFCESSIIQSMLSNQFKYNQAITGSGGAIYLDNCDIEKLQNNTFISNSAFIGGAIRYLTKKPLFILNNQMSSIKKQNFFIQNQYIAYGRDIASYPTILDVKSNEYRNKFSGNAVIEDVQSGYKAKYPIQLRFIDEEMREVNFVDLTQYKNVNKEIKEEFSIYTLQIESETIGLSGDLKQNYNKEQFAFEFDVSYSFKPSTSSNITIKSSQQLPYFSSNSQIIEQKQFDVQVEIKFRDCQIGEILLKNRNNTLCFTCEQGFYSIENPYESKDQSCKKCPVGSTNCSGSQISLEDGYWRSGEVSDDIVYCANKPESCSFSRNDTKEGCVKGFLGPLCEECDVKGQIWGDKYAKTNDFVCTDCNEFNSISNISIFIGIFIFIISQLFYKIFKQILATKKYIMAIYLAKLGLISPSIQRTQTTQSSLMKILLSYFQFMMIINSLNIPIPNYFSGFSLSGGDSSQQTINRIDCFLFKYDTGIPSYIIRIIWVNLQPVFLFLVLEILSQFTIQNTQVQAQKQTLYTNLIIVFSFFQPSQVKVLSQSISCREIGDSKYILSDLNQICLTDDHLYYFKTSILPLMIFWVFVGPLFLLYRMSHYKNQMNTIRIIFNYGYLYQEYHHKHYYWDIVKMFARSFTIITINLFNFNVLLKGLVINGLIQLYITLLNNNKPYFVSKFNDLDKESCGLVNKTIFLLYASYLSDNTIVNIIVAMLTISLNGLFILKMLSLILIKPINPIVKQRNVFEVFLYRMKQRIPYLFFWVKIGDTNRTRIFLLWKKVQKKFKESKTTNMELDKKMNRMMLQSMTSSSDFEKTRVKASLFRKSNY